MKKVFYEVFSTVRTQESLYRTACFIKGEFDDKIIDKLNATVQVKLHAPLGEYYNLYNKIKNLEDGQIKLKLYREDIISIAEYYRSVNDIDHLFECAQLLNADTKGDEIEMIIRVIDEE